MVTKAVKINFGLDEVDNTSQIPSDDYIKDFSKAYWRLSSCEEVEVDNLYSSMSDFADSEFMTTYEEHFGEVSELNNIYIEFGAPQYEGAISSRIFRALLGFVSFLREKYSTKLRIIIAVPKKFPETSTQGQYLTEHLREEMKNTCLYLYKQHEFLTCDLCKEDAAKVLKSTETENKKLFLSPSQRLGNNIVCHLGKFGPVSDHGNNIYDFYDGSRASTEVYVVLRNALAQKFRSGNRKKFSILYDESGLFDWFGDALINVEKHLLKNDGIEISTHSIIEFLESNGQISPDLILCPVVRSGVTLGKIVEKFAEFFPGKKIPHIMCLIFADGTDQNEPDVIKLPASDQKAEISIETFVQRGARGKFLKDIWEESEFSPQLPNELLEYDKEFSSASMWAMLFETNLVSERTGRARPKEKKFPDFRRLLENNRPLFLHKIRSIEDKFKLSGRIKYIFPDEPIPNELAKALCNEHQDKSIVPISPVLLEQAAGFGDGSWEEFQEYIEGPTFSDVLQKEFRNLSGKRTFLVDEGGHDTIRQSFCLIDTCRVTGSTLAGLEAIVNMLGGYIGASITIADFGFNNPKFPSPKNYRALYTFGGNEKIHHE